MDIYSIMYSINIGLVLIFGPQLKVKIGIKGTSYVQEMQLSNLIIRKKYLGECAVNVN